MTTAQLAQLTAILTKSVKLLYLATKRIMDNNYNVMTNWVFARESTDLSIEAKEKGCYINAALLAIGAGGGTYYDRNGAGSGYVEVGRHLLFSNSSIYVTVAARNGSSLVQVDGETLIEAAGGKGGNEEEEMGTVATVILEGLEVQMVEMVEMEHNMEEDMGASLISQLFI